MKKLLLAFLPLAVLASACSDDDGLNPDTPQTGHEISFYATAPKSSRAAATTTSSLQSFVVYAFTDSSVLMDGVTVQRDGGAWTYSPAVYWPASPVDFYAISPDMRKSSDTSASDYDVINGVQYGSTDLLYAVTPNQVESPAPVPLTFRHAMSQIAIMLSSTSDKYMVEVYHVSLNNIALSGDFALPNQNTAEDTALGTWTGLSDPKNALLYYDPEGKAILLTTTPRNLTEGNLEASFFVPQNLQNLEYSSANGFTGSFMQIDCVVKEKATGKQIWPNENTPAYLLVPQTTYGRMLFPLSTPTVTAWQQGYSYVYNVVINNTYSIDTIEFAPVVKDYITSQPF